MTTKKYHILTGGTSGMGLHVAKTLATEPASHLIVGARNQANATELRSIVSDDQLTVLDLDLESLDSTVNFADAAGRVVGSGSIDSIICNAGLQLLGPKELTKEGFEKTFAVNVLSHFLLTRRLLDVCSDNAAVITVGSGTHNPEDKIATRFGFRGGRLPENLQDLATGDLPEDGSDAQLGMDRYATSKLCAILIASGLAASENRVRFYSFDPGLMPGTGLARDRSLVERIGWTYLLPVMRYVVNGVSSGEASGVSLVAQCIRSPKLASGSYVEFTGKEAPRSAVSRDKQLAIRLCDFCDDLLQSFTAEDQQARLAG